MAVKNSRSFRTSDYQLRQHIAALTGMGAVALGKVRFLVGVDSSTSKFRTMLHDQGVSYADMYSSLSTAYNAMGDYQNDTLIVMPGSYTSGTTAFTWAKNYTNIIGAATPCHNGGRARISLTGADVATAFTISSRSVYMKGIHFQWGAGNASATTAISLTYSGNSNHVFENCDFEGPINATEAAAAYKLINIASGCQDTTFRNCRIGQWSTQANQSSGYEVNFAGNNANAVFEDCTFQAYSSNAGHCFINANIDLGGEAAMVMFNRCKFFQGDRDITLTKVLAPHATQGCNWFINCAAYNVTDWATAASAVVKVSAPAANEAGGIGTAPA